MTRVLFALGCTLLALAAGVVGGIVGVRAQSRATAREAARADRATDAVLSVCALAAPRAQRSP